MFYFSSCAKKQKHRHFCVVKKEFQIFSKILPPVVIFDSQNVTTGSNNLQMLPIWLSSSTLAWNTASFHSPFKQVTGLTSYLTDKESSNYLKYLTIICIPLCYFFLSNLKIEMFDNLLKLIITFIIRCTT